MVKNPVGGQTDSVVSEVRNMVLSYISQPNSLILAVSPANHDISNSDSLQIAHEVDPQRERTIGVLTKLDLMDLGTDAREILENELLHLKRGYVGVVNRSQQDLEDGKDIDYILEKETRFFQEHPKYRHLASRMGTKYLQAILHRQLRAHIHSTLPDVRNELEEKFVAVSKELDELNEKLGEAGNNDKITFMIKLVQQFAEALKMQLVGQSELVDINSIAGGAQINYLIFTKIQELLHLDLQPDKNKLAIAIANVPACRTSVSLPSLAFDAVCRDLMGQFIKPLEESVTTVVRVLVMTVKECADQINDYPTLRSVIIYKVNSQIKRQEKITKDILKRHIDAEMNFINLSHVDVDFSSLQTIPSQNSPMKIWSSGNADAITSTEAKLNEEMPTSEALLEKLISQPSTSTKVDYISAMISKYIEVVRKNIPDLAIKYIMFYLVKNVLQYTKADLLARLLDSGTVDSLIIECEDDIQRQKQLEVTLEVITSALEAINEF